MKYIHFNNAGSSICKQNVLKKIKSYIDLENMMGGYEAQEKEKKSLYKFYENTSKLINSEPHEISFLTNSTLAWNLAFNSIFLNKKENIVILQNEYSSNHISILKRKNNFKNLRIVNINQRGLVDLDDLKKKIDSKTKLLSINHIASQSGNIMPVKEIGLIFKRINPDGIYMLDCCQSVGQVEIDVKKFKCDILTASGRKYLMGPRGTGFIYISKSIKDKFNPIFEDMSSVRIINLNKYKKYEKSHIFEMFEHSPALKLGLSRSVENILKIGVSKIQNKIFSLSSYLRKRLEKNNKIVFCEDPNSLSGINTLYFKKKTVRAVYDFLKKRKINVYMSKENTSYLYFKKIQRKDVLRISLNYYNTKKEIDYCSDTIEEFVGK